MSDSDLENYRVSVENKARELIKQYWEKNPRTPEQVKNSMILYSKIRTLKELEDENPRLYVLDREKNCIDVFWSGHAYEIDLDRIKDPRDLCEWLVHINRKSWKLATPYRIAKFIETVFSVKGWTLWEGC